MWWSNTGRALGMGQLMRIARGWSKRPELQKPDVEEELPRSNIPDAEEQSAIARERERRSIRD